MQQKQNGVGGGGYLSSSSNGICKAFSGVVADLWSTSGQPVCDPSPFKREMGKFANKFLGFDQHDSQEFLQYALEGLHKELNRVKKEDKNNNNAAAAAAAKDGNGNKVQDPDDPEEEGISPEECGRRCWRLYLRRDDSLVTDLFLGQFRSTLKCDDCGHESVTFEPFWAVSVPIPPGGGKSSGSGSYARSRFRSGSDANGDEPTGIKLKDCLDLFVKGKCTS